MRHYNSILERAATYIPTGLVNDYGLVMNIIIDGRAFRIIVPRLPMKTSAEAAIKPRVLSSFQFFSNGAVGFVLCGPRDLGTSDIGARDIGARRTTACNRLQSEPRSSSKLIITGSKQRSNKSLPRSPSSYPSIVQRWILRCVCTQLCCLCNSPVCAGTAAFAADLCGHHK